MVFCLYVELLGIVENEHLLIPESSNVTVILRVGNLRD